METRTWVCPALCGCELRITADWSGVADPVNDGTGRRVMFKHPNTNSQTNITALSVCATHDHLKTDPIDESIVADRYASIFLTTIPLHVNRYQQYLDHPDDFSCIIQPPRDPNNMTEDEKLYLGLLNLTSEISHLGTCDCKISFLNDGGVTTLRQHPRDSYKCKYHLNDDDQHTQALSESKLKDDLEVAFKKVPGVMRTLTLQEKDSIFLMSQITGQPLEVSQIPNEVQVVPFKANYDDQRILNVETDHISSQMKNDLISETNKLNVKSNISIK